MPPAALTSSKSIHAPQCSHSLIITVSSPALSTRFLSLPTPTKVCLAAVVIVMVVLALIVVVYLSSMEVNDESNRWRPSRSVLQRSSFSVWPIRHHVLDLESVGLFDADHKTPSASLYPSEGKA
jgi:hypothetical protein